MPNSLLTPTVIAKEGLMQLRNNVVMGGLVHREYREEFKKIGDSIQIRRPVKFTRTSGATRTNQDVSEGYITMQINNRHHVSWAFSTQDLTLTIKDYSERYITPAAIELGNGVDADLLALYDDVANCVGTPGSVPASFAALGAAAIRLDDNAAPDDGRRNIVLNPDARWTLADALKGTFDATLAKDVIRRGLLGKLANMMVYGDQNVARHTTGTRAGDASVLTSAAVSDSWSASSITSSVPMDAFSSATGTLKAGDVFTIANVFAVNPRTRQSTGKLQPFVITADVAVSGSAGTAIVFPRIIASGAYQTVSASAADNAAVTFYGSAAAATAYPQNLAFHRNAFGLVFIPLELPRSAGFKARSTMEGVSLRIVEDFDIDNDTEIIRMDILNATKTLYPELACRIWG
jgi:hypothetical protein